VSDISNETTQGMPVSSAGGSVALDRVGGQPGVSCERCGKFVGHHEDLQPHLDQHIMDPLKGGHLFNIWSTASPKAKKEIEYEYESAHPGYKSEPWS